MSRKKIALLCAAAVLTLLAAAALIWRETLFLPAWVEWRSAQLACGADGTPERIELSGGRVRVYSGGVPVWETEKHIRVQDASACRNCRNRSGRFGKNQACSSACRDIVSGRKCTFAV